MNCSALYSHILQGRIVNNNTVPSGGPATPPELASEVLTTTEATSTTMWSSNRNATQRPQAGPTQYLIHEEGGLERWFNLTITNVGVDAVADYTCVAVNAGGVMEEAITLTFEEPEPVNTFSILKLRMLLGVFSYKRLF